MPNGRVLFEGEIDHGKFGFHQPKKGGVRLGGQGDAHSH